MKSFWDREPVAVLVLVESALVLAVAFGLDLDADQMKALLVFFGALLGVTARSQVQPKA